MEENKKELWNTSEEYRKKVIRELEKSGRILPLDGRSFHELVKG